MTFIKSRKDFEHNLHILEENMRLGKVKFTISSIQSVKGIQNARYSPNMRTNFLTINESARLMANTVAHMDQNKNDLEIDEQ